MKTCVMKTVFVVLFASLFRHEFQCCESTSDKLIARILDNGYRKEVRPRCPDEPAVNVVIDLALRQIIEIIEPKQILQTIVWLRVEWNDCRLSWNETEFGVSNFILPSTLIWYPDVTLYDSADKGMDAAKKYRIIVKSNGATRHQIPVVLTSLCKIDTTYFPFDRQFCPLTFGMWSYSGLEVNITNLNINGDLDSYKRHVEWSVASLKATRVVEDFIGVRYPSVKYTLELRRKPQFFVLNLLFPSILISLVATLGFMLPPDSVEKVNLEVTVLLSLAVFQLIILHMMPPNSDTLPFISIYFATTMVLVGLSCFMTVVVINIHFRGHRGWRVPDTAKTVFIKGLGRLLCVKKPIRKRERHTNNDGVHGVRFEQKQYSATAVDKITFGNTADTNGNLGYFQRINDSLNEVVSHICENGDKEVNEEWHLMALVLDRTFLLLYGFLTFFILFVFTVEFLSQ